MIMPKDCIWFFFFLKKKENECVSFVSFTWFGLDLGMA